VDRPTFFTQLKESRLLSHETVAGLNTRFGANEMPQDIANALVDEGLLTLFQAKEIWSGRAKGLVLGQYRILEEIGKGGFGQVYKAVHTMMDRQVAIKVISPELVKDSRARSWFRREVLASTQFTDPNVVLAHDADEIDGILFLVMEYVEGPNLDAYVKEHGPLPYRLACEMMRQAALALQHAHAKGMVHRDIKPANLLLPLGHLPPAALDEHAAEAARSGSPPVLVKVADFGLARLHHQAPAGTLMLQNENSFLGTPDYVSPEQARNLHAVDIRSDLYSLGCTFYYALSARAPFRGTTVLEVVVQHLEREPEPLRSFQPDAPEAIDELLRRLMAKEPDERFATPAELVSVLTSICSPESNLANSQRTPFTDPALQEKRTLGSVPAGADAAGTPTAVVPDLAFWNGPVLSQLQSALQPVVREDNADRQRESVPYIVSPGDPDRVPQPARAGECSDADHVSETPVPYAPPAALRESWKAWLAIIEALGKGKRVRVNATAYRDLHRTLLEQCRLPAGTPRPVILQRVEELVSPWLTPQALAAVDQETLASLHHQCLEANEALFGPSRSSHWLVGVLAAAVVAAIILGWCLSSSRELNSVLENGVDSAWSTVVRRPFLSVSVAIPAVVLGALGILSRLLRA
jgi:eukaryotic-like serine/threonine-protein kinase